MAKNTAQPQQSASQSKRRAIYGTNVAIAVMAAIAIAIFFNWMVDVGFRQAPPSLRPWISYDLTATRRYSLSKQTTDVLADLKKRYQIVTIFDSQSPSVLNAEQLQRVSDLVDDYQRYSSNVHVEHVNIADDVAAVQALYKKILDRYTDKLKPVKAAITNGQQAANHLVEQIPSMVTPLETAIKDPKLKQGSLKKLIQQVAGLLTQDQQQLSNLHVKKSLQQPLPDFGTIKSKLQSAMQQFDQGLLQPAISKFNPAADASSTPTSVQNDLSAAVAAMKHASADIQSALPGLTSVKNPQTYDDVRNAVTSKQCVVILGPKEVRVVPANKMYRSATARQIKETGHQISDFIGEQRLTGALVSMTLKHPPMVVFVIQGGPPALGPRGQYSDVAKRLRAANIDVRQWYPAGGRTTFGSRMPPQPPPKPAKGQKAVWIVLPNQSRSPMGMTGGAGKQVAAALETRLAKGDGIMAMFGANPNAQYGPPNPVKQLLEKRWGIKPQLDRIILRQIQRPDQSTQNSTNIPITNWPSKTPIGQALAGLRGVMLQASPILTSKPKKTEVQYWPLIEAKGNRLFTTSDLSSAKAVTNAAFNKNTAKPSFTVAVAAYQKAGGRVVVVDDPVWATNQVVNYGYYGPGTASLTGAVFPANGELFTNSVYWLAGLNKLIAASPASHDIARVGNISGAAMTGYEVILLVLVPALVLASGLTVWMFRRRE